MNMEGYTFIMDIDGTLCPIKDNSQRYEDLVPFSDVVDRLRQCKLNGARIVLFTSRNMNSYGGNIGLINRYTAPKLIEWLEKWNIPYDEIIYGKPWPGKKGFYIDDRTLRPDEFVNGTIDDFERICGSSTKDMR